MAGRPTKYNDEIAAKLCEITATSCKSLKTICDELGLKPRTVLDWLKINKEFSHIYARSKEEQADLLAEQIIEIADNKDGDFTEGEFGKIGNAANVQRSRLQVDARKWIASKLKPRKYGDKVEVENTGEVKIITANFGSPIIQSAPKSTEDTQLD